MLNKAGAVWARRPCLAILKLKAVSGVLLPVASLPFTGAWTSRRMSKYCPARKSVLLGDQSNSDGD